MKKSDAFSLLELLVAMSIFSLLMLVLLEASNTALSLSQKTTHRQATAREATASLQMIMHDLQETVITTNSESLLFNIATNDLKTQPNLFFLASLPREGRPAQDLGDLHAIGYFLAPSDHTEKKELYRFLAHSEETMNALRTGQLLELYQRASPTNTTYCERIATNITDFQATPRWLSQKKLFPPEFIELKITAGVSQNEPVQTWRTFVLLP